MASSTLTEDQYLILENITELRELGIRVCVGYVSGHSYIEGNNIADEICSEQLKYSLPPSIEDISSSFFRQKARKKVSNSTAKPDYQGFYSSISLSPSSKKQLWRSNRKIAVTTLRIMSNHINLNSHFLRLRRARLPLSPTIEDSSCRFCKEAEETIEHLIQECNDNTVSVARTKLPQALRQQQAHVQSDTFQQQLTIAISDPTTWSPLAHFFQELSVNL